MNDYKIADYVVPGLSDVGTLRLPTANAPVAERWLTGQGSRILSNAPVREGGQVIRFEDPAYRSIIDRLVDNSSDGQFDFFDRVAVRPQSDREISQAAYTALQRLKVDQAPPDFIDRILKAPQQNWDTINPNYPADTAKKLRLAYDRIGVPIERMDFITLGDMQRGELGERQRNLQGISNYVDDPSVPQYGFNPYKGKDGVMFLPTQKHPGFTQADNRSLIQGLADRIIESNNRIDTQGMPAQVIPGTGAGELVSEATNNNAKRIHNAATRFAIEKNLIQDPEELRNAFSTMMNQIKSADRSYENYVIHPEFRNQIRTAGRFAGSLFA